jgi:hypothetical protein
VQLQKQKGQKQIRGSFAALRMTTSELRGLGDDFRVEGQEDNFRRNTSFAWCNGFFCR